MNTDGLRVLHVLGELKPSGAETMLLAAAPCFAEQGVQGEILSTGARQGVFAEKLSNAGYHLHHIAFSPSPLFFWRVRRLMASGFDVIHLHTERANFWLGLIALWSGASRVLRTIHNAFEFENGLRKKRGWQRRTLQANGLIHVSISESVRQNEIKRFDLDTTLVANWYDSRRFVARTEDRCRAARAALGLPADKTVVVSIGNCSKVKNHGALIEALALMSPETRPLYLHIGIEEAGEPERRLAEKLGVQDSVCFLGPQGDVLPALLASDIFVMPSLYEGFGIAAIEALATGMPAIFSDVPGLRDFRTQFPGLIYAGTDAASLANALTTVVESQEGKTQLAEYPSIAQRLFGVERGTAEYLRLYRPQPEAVFSSPEAG